MALAAGDEAPAFTLPAAGGGTASLADFSGRMLVLYFYPKAATEACTLQAGDFSRLADAFAEAGAAVLGISHDPVKALDRFRDRQGLTIGLASDESTDVLEAYGVWAEKSMYGRTFLGIVRTTFLIGPDGRILRIWPKVRVKGHAEEVLAAVRALRTT